MKMVISVGKNPGKDSYFAGKNCLSTTWQKITVKIIFVTAKQVRNIVLECDCC